MRRQLRVIILLVVLIFCLGTAGYIFLEGYTPAEAFYMTVITVTTVGFGEVRPLSPIGRVFTACLILFGLASIALATRTAVEAALHRMLNRNSERLRMQKRIDGLRSHTIICGFGRVGEAAAEALSDKGMPFVVVEVSQGLHERLREEDVPHILGDAMNEESLADAGIKRAAGLLAVLPSDADNLFITLTAREMNPTLRIVARAEGAASEKKLLQGGADSVISPLRTAGLEIARSMLAEVGAAGPQHTRNHRPPAARKKVLIVDDNPVILKLYHRLLWRAGFHPLSASNGREGLETILAREPAAAVIDCMLPEMSGIEVCRRVRSSGKARRCHLIVFTGDDHPSTRREALDAGADTVVVKSPEATELIRAVTGILKESPSQEEVPSMETEANDNPGDILDIEEIRAKTGGDEEFLREIYQVFREDSAELIMKIHEAIGASDMQILERAAHSLKGAISNFCKGPAWEAARSLEEMGRNGCADDAPVALERMEREVHKVCDALEQVRF